MKKQETAKTKVVVPWHNLQQLEKFTEAWQISTDDPRILFQRDAIKQGCALTKNQGIEAAISSGAEVIIILDDDCFPDGGMQLDEFIQRHLEALEPQNVEMFEVVTSPPSRGTPYFNRLVKMPVAASMGFWTYVGDYDAPGQLVHGATSPMDFQRKTIFGRYFPLCGLGWHLGRANGLGVNSLMSQDLMTSGRDSYGRRRHSTSASASTSTAPAYTP